MPLLRVLFCRHGRVFARILKRHTLLLLVTLVITTCILIRSHQQLLRNEQHIEYDEGVHNTTKRIDFSYHSNTRDPALLAYSKKWVGFPDMSGVDCDVAFTSRAKNELYPRKVRRVFPAQYIEDSQDCDVFTGKYGFNRYPPSTQEEREFPLAFIILFHKDLDQVLLLLRAIYRPHNVVCLTVDTKVSVEFLEAVRSVSKCLPNVFVASKLESIVYAGFSRLMADIDCMQDLVKHPVQWKYVINIPGQQFPLKTNLEIVKILALLNGTNDIKGVTGVKRVEARFYRRYSYVRNDKTGNLQITQDKEYNRPPPHGLKVVKGSAYGTYSWRFANFVLHSPIAKDFLEWCKTVYSPDEYFWATLQHTNVTSVPGGYTGPPDLKPFFSTYVMWIWLETCEKAVRCICIADPVKLWKLSKHHEFFANKFYITYQPAALHCLDEKLFNMTVKGEVRDLKLYERLASKISKYSVK